MWFAPKRSERKRGTGQWPVPFFCFLMAFSLFLLDIQEYAFVQEDIEAKKRYSLSALAKRNNGTDNVEYNAVDKSIFWK